ncbi:hypothetical protein BgAZ_402980 [Babesia gibsoni]|uniref:Uncharacterized protein n=1 Tax=Babesia gibsoni TaxID=33632 RepID=A0AAD8LMR8_BABGI|nr:hypothetical protein BgAZ_402980 [Babesia gibsoni]
MPVDDAAKTDGATPQQGDEDARPQSYGEMFMEVVTAIGSGIRMTFVEANRCVRTCVYPAKQKCIKVYDNLTNSMRSGGAGSIESVSAASRFGNDCDLSD